MRRRSSVLFMLPAFMMLALLGLAACGGPGETEQPAPQDPAPQEPAPQDPTPEPTPVPTEPEGDSVSSDISDFVLENLTIAPGTTVTWTNRDSVPHTATSGEPGAQTGEFDSGNLGQGESYSHTFAQEGEFAYFCVVHPNMTATVRVTADTDSAAPDTATPAPVAPAAPDYDYDDYGY